ncbi:MAG TPA: hypothetical protein VH208_05355, partial [Myxococcaceae bacterium]|nr:hypothetical protein [Myxococcaceae bacterium]
IPDASRATSQIPPLAKRTTGKPGRSAALGEDLPPTEAAHWSRIVSDAPPTLPPDAPPPALLGETTIPDGSVLGSSNGRVVPPGRAMTRDDRPVVMPPSPVRAPTRDDRPAAALPGAVISASRRQPRRSSRAPAVVLLLLLIGLIAGAGVLLYRRQTRLQRVEPASPALRHSIAVLTFQNLGARPEKAWLSDALAEMLSAELAAGGQLRVIPGDQVARMQRELSLEDPGSLSQSTLQRAAKNVGSEYLVSGAFLSMGESTSSLRVDVHLQRADSESVASESGPEASARDLASKLGADLRQKLGLGEPFAEDAARARALFSLNPEALRDHATGLAALRRMDLPAARDALERSVETDPEDPLAQAALAEALAGLGRDEDARAAIQRAVKASDKLSHAEVLRLRARQAELASDWTGAAAAYRELVVAHADEIEAVLGLAQALRRSGDASGARKALQGSDDPRVDLELAALADAPQQAVAAAQRAGDKAN